MLFDVAIKVENLSKCYQIYDKPTDRLKQMAYPRLQRLGGRSSKCYYREFWSLKDVSFSVKKGETVGIIGRNGSGKSTLLQMICGTLNQTSGNIYTNGRVAALLELGSGFNPEFTGRENIYLNASVLGLHKEEIDAKFNEIEKFADIGTFIEQPVKTYSSGMYVRLAFAVVAHVDADILVVDEALAVGDAYFTQKCMRFLRDFMKRGTILFVSHDTESIKSLCNSAIWIDKGSIHQIGTPKEVCENYLKSYYEQQQNITLTNHVSSRKKKGGLNIDQRRIFINTSNLRNDIKVFEFEESNNSFGAGGAKIIDVNLVDQAGDTLVWIVGGEEVCLRISVEFIKDLSSVIVGFSFKDHLGQVLFGDNTWLSYLDDPVNLKQGELIEAEFSFQMPRLQKGNYSINAAIASGSQQEHIQQHWIHDAIILKSESTSVSSGIIGIPMSSIALNVIDPA